jgi:hypothetical protein
MLDFAWLNGVQPVREEEDNFAGGLPNSCICARDFNRAFLYACLQLPTKRIEI